MKSIYDYDDNEPYIPATLPSEHLELKFDNSINEVYLNHNIKVLHSRFNALSDYIKKNFLPDLSNQFNLMKNNIGDFFNATQDTASQVNVINTQVSNLTSEIFQTHKANKEQLNILQNLANGIKVNATKLFTDFDITISEIKENNQKYIAERRTQNQFQDNMMIFICVILSALLIGSIASMFFSYYRSNKKIDVIKSKATYSDSRELLHQKTNDV